MKESLEELGEEIQRTEKESRDKLKDEWLPQIERELDALRKKLKQFGREKDLDSLEEKMEKIRNI